MDFQDVDVFLGRGGATNQKRQGSLYRQLILENYEYYQTLPSKAKRAFAVEKVMYPIIQKGGKFLVYDQEKKEWVPVQITTEPASCKDIASKVMQAIIVRLLEVWFREQDS